MGGSPVVATERGTFLFRFGIYCKRRKIGGLLRLERDSEAGKAKNGRKRPWVDLKVQMFSH